MLNLFLVTILFTQIIYTTALETEDVPALEDESTELDLSMYSRIVGGQKTDIESHPYQASFMVNGSHFCGAFIVSRKYILTAAHCVRNADPSNIVLRAGSSWWKNGTIIPIAEVIPHPGYKRPSSNKDVAVLKTVDPIKFTKRIQPIKLPSKNRPMKEGTEVGVSGWGRVKQGVPGPIDELEEVWIPVVNYAKCLQVYETSLTKNMFCGGNFNKGGKSFCKGDSGGTGYQDGMAVGIVSFSRGCGKPSAPSVFTNIAAPAIRTFIQKHTGL